MVAVTEGGYDLHALAASLNAVAESLNGSAAPPEWPVSGLASTRGRATADAVRPMLAPFWDL